jgi:hypothetical protein
VQALKFVFGLGQMYLAGRGSKPGQSLWLYFLVIYSLHSFSTQQLDNRKAAGLCSGKTIHAFSLYTGSESHPVSRPVGSVGYIPSI